MDRMLAGLLPDALLVGVPEIDVQHEEIFVRIESLKDACFGNDAPPFDDCADLLRFLASHFETEETLARKARLEFSSHTQAHQTNFSALNRALEEVRSGARDVHSFLRYFEFWFERHILDQDKPLGLSLKQ